MSVIRDIRYEYQAANRASDVDPFVADICRDLSDTYDEISRQIRKLREDSHRFGNTGAARSFLSQAAAQVADALDSVRAARSEIR